MKSVIAVIFGLILSGWLSEYPASAQQTAKEVKIEAILKLTRADATLDQMLKQIQTMAASRMPPGTTPEEAAKQQEIQAKIFDVFKSHMSLDKLLPQYIKIYSDTFSDEEIDGIYAFYQSPAGFAMINKMPLMLPKMMEVVQAQMVDIMPEIEAVTKGSTLQ